jgi:hypothetical protein
MDQLDGGRAEGEEHSQEDALDLAPLQLRQARHSRAECYEH